MMKTKPEILDVVDERDQVIGRKERLALHRRGLLHRAIHILVFDRSGRLFLQKRSVEKATFPRCYDSSSSGHVDAGESYDACARRELLEELGLRPQEYLPLRRLFKLAACRETGGEHVWVYVTRATGAIHPDPSEIESGLWLSWEQAERLIRWRPGDCATGFVRIVEEVQLRGGRRLWAHF